MYDDTHIIDCKYSYSKSKYHKIEKVMVVNWEFLIDYNNLMLSIQRVGMPTITAERIRTKKDTYKLIMHIFGNN